MGGSTKNPARTPAELGTSEGGGRVGENKGGVGALVGSKKGKIRDGWGGGVFEASGSNVYPQGEKIPECGRTAPRSRRGPW